MTHICVGKLTIICSDNRLAPGRRQAIIWTNAGILLIRTIGTSFSEILIEIRTFSFKKIRLRLSSGTWRSFCLGLSALTRLIPGRAGRSLNHIIYKVHRGTSLPSDHYHKSFGIKVYWPRCSFLIENRIIVQNISLRIMTRWNYVLNLKLNLYFHWNGNIVILMTFYLPAAPKVVNFTLSVVTMQWWRFHQNYNITFSD